MKTQAGMTLVEALVAVALLGLLAVGITSAFRFGERSYRQVVRRESAQRDVMTAQRVMRHIVETAYPFDSPSSPQPRRFGIEGQSARLLVTAPMPVSRGSKGFYRYDLSLTAGPDRRKNWVVREWLDRDGQSEPSSEASVDGSPEVLLEDVRAVRMSYLEPVQTQGGIGNDPAWRDEWLGKQHPPLLVRVHIEFPEGDSRVWPDLMVAPRITDSASCEFDQVAQRCRGSQP